MLYYSHSVVPGGFPVKSYTTRPIHGTSDKILCTISSRMLSVIITFPDASFVFHGMAGTPVMKSLVIKVRMAILLFPSSPNPTGNKITGT